MPDKTREVILESGISVKPVYGPDDLGVQRGIAWLCETQLSTGTWDEPWFTGTGFPGDFYINYHLYRLTFPVMALSRFVNGTPS